MASSEESRWRSWPNGEGGKQLAHVLVACPVDNLYRTLFGPASAFVLEAHDIRGNKGYVETAWLGSEADADAAQLPLVSPKPAVSDAQQKLPTKGQARRVAFNSVGMGMKYKTEELQRIIDARSGECYTVDGCVNTTATYGDKFRPLTRYKKDAVEIKKHFRTNLRLVAKGDKTELTIVYTLVFVLSVNYFIRSAIERGAEGGLAKNFAQLLEVLGKKVPVKDAEKAAAAAAAQGEEAKERGAEALAVGSGLQWFGLVDRELVALLQPTAASLCSLLPFGLVGEQVRIRPAAVAQTLALLLMVLAVNSALNAVHGLQVACQHSTGVFGQAGARVLAILRLDTSVRTVLASYLIVVVVRSTVTLAVAVLPTLTKALAERRAQLAAAAQATNRSPSMRAASISGKDAPDTGLRFEGFDDAIATVTEDSGWSWTGTRALNAMKDMLSPRYSAIMSMSAYPEAKEGTPPLSRSFTGSRPAKPRPRVTENGEPHQAQDQNGGELGTAEPSEKDNAEPEPETEPTGPYLCELFENERCQPFRGWGHTWPGHFLPTDRVGHWSTRDGGPGGKASMSFRSVAPKLPPGFTWLEEKWHVDLSGQSAAAVDADGWAYAVDFPWLRMPPLPGMGRKSVKDFVRRRRWIRTRVPVDSIEARQAGLGSAPVSFDGLSQALGLQDGLVGGASPPRLHEALSFPRRGALSDDEAEALAAEVARPTSPALSRDSPSSQPLVKSSSGNSLTPGATSSPEPPMSDGNVSPSVPPLDVAAVSGGAAATAQTGLSAEAAEDENGSDGDSPRYSAHPATTAIIQHTTGGGSRGSPASTGTNSPSVAAAAAAQRSSFKMGTPSWLQVSGKCDGTPTARVGLEAGNRATAIGRTISNASAEAAAPGSPASSRGSRVGDAALSEWNGDGSPGPSPLGLGSGRLTADQAAAAARILMAGGKLPGSPTTQTNSPFARAQDGGHISFSTGGRGSSGPPARAHSQGRLGSAQRPAAAHAVPAEQLTEAPMAQLEWLGSAPQLPPRVRSETSMSRIGEETADVSAAANTTAAAAEQGPLAQVPSTALPDVSTDPAGDRAGQQVSEQSDKQVQAAHAVPPTGDDATAMEVAEREKTDRNNESSAA